MFIGISTGDSSRKEDSFFAGLFSLNGKGETFEGGSLMNLVNGEIKITNIIYIIIKKEKNVLSVSSWHRRLARDSTTANRFI